MPTFRALDLDTLARTCLDRVGVPQEDAALVADHLVEAGLMGHDTHSVLRLPQYVDMVRDGIVEPGAELEILTESDFGAQLSGRTGPGAPWRILPPGRCRPLPIATVTATRPPPSMRRGGSRLRRPASFARIAIVC